jgi:hypothetical protein
MHAAVARAPSVHVAARAALSQGWFATASRLHELKQKGAALALRRFGATFTSLPPR